MPLAPLRACPASGCPELTRGGPCPRHLAARNRAIDERRGTSAARGYDAKWRRVRGYILSRPSAAYRDEQGIIRGQGPLCVMCKVEDARVTPATDVDHIDGNSRNNAYVNLRPLCHAHHSRRTATDQGFGRRPRGGRW